MTPLVFDLTGNATIADGIVASLGAERGALQVREFPDGETHVRIDSDCKNREAIIICTLDRPNAKVVPLLLVAATLRDLGAARIGLVAPYLAYMRQDSRFKAGEGISAGYFANLLSSHFDWLVTVDPHLHRIHSLDAIYSTPTTVVCSAPLLAKWVTTNVASPLLIGPDMESEQWVAEVARHAGAPFRILHKERAGDRDVSVSTPDVHEVQALSPVLIDDIASTGRTFIAAIEVLEKLGMAKPTCLAVHGVFADDAFADMHDAGAVRIVTCNTIVHDSNELDVTPLLASACRDHLA